MRPIRPLQGAALSLAVVPACGSFTSSGGSANTADRGLTITGILAKLAYAGRGTEVVKHCTGPFTITAQKPQPSMSLERHAGYWQTKAAPAKVEARFLPDFAALGTWGLAAAQPFLGQAPHLVVYPVLAIFVTALSVTMIGQGINARRGSRS